MADVFLPQQPFMATMTAVNHGRLDSDSSNSPSFSPALPNPSFVFPMQHELSTRHTVAEPDPTSDDTTNRRWKQRTRPHGLSFNALPDFEFHPSQSSNETSLPTTPSSPTHSRIIPPHPTGHRRNGSEFIGGDGKNATTGLMSSSPTKGGGSLPPPPGARTGAPVGGRRGHAHRRSGAISSHDVSAILKPTNEVRSGSAPSTPSDPLVQPAMPPFLDRSISQPTTTLSSMNELPDAHHRQRSSTIGQARPRVGFSDHVEFIPRRLSTISSETSSSLSTIRPSHSVTGSISSVISNANASPPSARKARSLGGDEEENAVVSSPFTKCSPRPGDISSAAHCVSELPSDGGMPETGSHSDLPSWAEVFTNPSPPRAAISSTPSVDPAGLLRLSGTPESLRNRRRSLQSSTSPLVRPRTSPEPKVSKRQRKVKSWAGSILARKARHSTNEEVFDGDGEFLPLQPPSAFPYDLSLENLNFDEDTTCVIQTAPSPSPKASSVKLEPSSPKSGEQGSEFDFDEPSPILDLDAALGSFNSNSLSPSFDEVTGSRHAAVRRRLHSSGTTGGFDGPGMHYHRRAESAPEMAPVNRQIFGFTRLGSNSAMADVFEEDEEDDFISQEQHGQSQTPAVSGQEEGEKAQGLGVPINDVAENTGSAFGRITQPRAVGIPTTEDDDTAFRTPNALSAIPASSHSDKGADDIVDAHAQARMPTAIKSTLESNTGPSLANDSYCPRPVSAPIQFMLPTPSPAFAAPEIYSSLSTPDFSQSSFEGPRLHTASSSMTDHGTLSSFRGEQGFDLRPSVDDVPSLTSSASTMTNSYPRRVSSSAPTRPSADRPSSLSSVPIPRPRPANAMNGSKRSSLASLSRLVGGSHGEKSKLNIEERPQSSDNEKSEKKRGHRIGRLMRFWKSKEKLTS
ncbi:MAG: hypothetical protein Q9194_004502 [Teloschistes cf. exilis]